MSTLGTPRHKEVVDSRDTAPLQAASPAIAQLVQHVSQRERAGVARLLQTLGGRAQSGKYFFTDSPSVTDRQREGEPQQYGSKYQPGMEAAFTAEVAAARKAFERTGSEHLFDAYIAGAQRTFMQRRQSEEAVIAGDTVSELLDFIDASPATAQLSRQLTKASEWLKQKRQQDIAKQPFFKRMGSRFQRMRQFLGNDHPIERIDVMAEVVAALNAQGPREQLTGAQVSQVLKQLYPQAFLLPAGTVVPPSPDVN